MTGFGFSKNSKPVKGYSIIAITFYNKLLLVIKHGKKCKFTLYNNILIYKLNIEIK
jgi:hypothetical protein